MKFENIKKGDIVFILKEISTGWNTSKSFFIPVKVERVTKTQFILENLESPSSKFIQNASDITISIFGENTIKTLQ